MERGPGLKSVGMGFSKGAYNLLPAEEIRAFVQEGDNLSTADKWRLGLTAISKTASLGAWSVAGAQAITAKIRPQTVLSGHGSYTPTNGTFTVPEGASVKLYSEVGQAITDRLGNAIETGTMNRIGYIKTFSPGEAIPDLTLHPPTGLSIMGKPLTVTTNTPLSQLVQPGGGVYHWAACSVVCRPFTVADIVSTWRLSIITPADAIAAGATFSGVANNISSRRTP